MPKLIARPFHGRLPKKEKLRRSVELNLSEADAVIALTDVYTGSNDFKDAEDAKRQMREWVGANPSFHAHVAQYDFEAWLLPYWDEIQKLSGSNRRAPGGHPESVDHNKPPSKWIEEIFRAGGRRDYIKPVVAARILESQDLTIAAQACPELKAFLDTILGLCGCSSL